MKDGLDSFYHLVFGLGVLAGGQRHQNRPCCLQLGTHGMKCMSWYSQNCGSCLEEALDTVKNSFLSIRKVFERNISQQSNFPCVWRRCRNAKNLKLVFGLGCEASAIKTDPVFACWQEASCLQRGMHDMKCMRWCTQNCFSFRGGLGQGLGRIISQQSHCPVFGHLADAQNLTILKDGLDSFCNLVLA